MLRKTFVFNCVPYGFLSTKYQRIEKRKQTISCCCLFLFCNSKCLSFVSLAYMDRFVFVVRVSNTGLTHKNVPILSMAWENEQHQLPDKWNIYYMGRMYSVFLLLYVFGCVKTVLNFNTVVMFQLICYVDDDDDYFDITLLVDFPFLYWRVNMCMYESVSEWVSECVSKIENRISIILLIYYNLLRLWMQICCVCRSLLSRCLFFCLQFSVSLLFCVVNCWANSSGVYMLYSFDIVCELQLCVCCANVFVL